MIEYPVLIASNGPLDGQQWFIDQTLTIGRDEQCQIVIPDRQVSRQHARLSFQDKAILEDLGSKNGTFVNTQRIEGTCILRDGDEVQISLVQTFIYLSSDATLPLGDLPPEMSYAFKLRLDQASKRVWVRGVELDPALSAQQFNLLALLYKHVGEVVARETLISAVWGDEANWVTEQAFDALVRRLRDRLYQLDPEYDYIVTVRGHGLRLENNPH